MTRSQIRARADVLWAIRRDRVIYTSDTEYLREVKRLKAVAAEAVKKASKIKETR